MWDLTGKRVKAQVAGETRTGTVESSRIKYGGRIQHTVILDEPVVYRWRSQDQRVVLVAHEQVQVL